MIIQCPSFRNCFLINIYMLITKLNSNAIHLGITSNNSSFKNDKNTELVFRRQQILVVQSLSHVQVCAIPETAACQASLSFTISWSLLKLMSIELVIPSTHLVLCHPLLLLPSIFPSIRVFSNELALHITWPKYWSFNFSISPSNEYSGLVSSKFY